MLNHRVRAAAEGMPRFDRAAIMAHAWRLYRNQWTGARPANLQARRKSFSRCLKSAWMTAKWDAAEALKTATQRAADRVQELTFELMRDDARDWRVSGRADRRAIYTEIAGLEGRA
ncbi:hypothetical protein SAMN05216228_1008105 [Rhizobium tibeticum]|uniref:Uncharacterized protein n=2 Tax=Rhizobium tibeticum TaxID=501024 RepID=A0A1H8JY15_9HYPH|nr:hypothetical protein RTCCBAU85039_2353 [Rhizobium tibeticum]SEN85613.1 hypothetical protein SAMN05216228_1008105 [Rhizobium tibeticum]